MTQVQLVIRAQSQNTKWSDALDGYVC